MIDLVKIKVTAGKGGSGAVSFLTLKNMRHGKPDGGDGGQGASIFLESSIEVFDLENFRHKVNWTAGDGENGAKMKKKGKDGVDLVLKVPAGTVVSFDNVTFDLTEPGQKILLVRGGQGGRGNSHTGDRRDKKGRRPNHWQQFNIAQKGKSGEEQSVQLELKYIAQIGIIGLPNVGKSTLLSVLTNAKPKIADYPFTTLEPNVGVIRGNQGDEGIVIADIPGIIAGAAMGKGLGFQFLRHIERTKLLIHVLDASSADLIKDFKVVRGELKLYGQDLDQKQEIVVVNKIDQVGEEEKNKIKALFKRKKVFFISAMDGYGLEQLKEIIVKLTN